MEMERALFMTKTIKITIFDAIHRSYSTVNIHGKSLYNIELSRRLQLCVEQHLSE